MLPAIGLRLGTLRRRLFLLLAAASVVAVIGVNLIWLPSALRDVRAARTELELVAVRGVRDQIDFFLADKEEALTTIAQLKLQLEEKSHRLAFETGADRLEVFADPQLLRQVVLNLASNAIKYSPSRGQISVRLVREDDLVRWQIQDTGIGIPKESQRHLFEKFYRADNVAALETDGTGLGLYLVRLIVEQFGGHVGCESEEGQGATFFFTVPCAPPLSSASR